MTGSSTPDLTAIQAGFSAMADEYDRLTEKHPVVIWMRRRIRTLVEQQIAPGASILEINCGSGLDAAYFARKGYRVHAMDVAPGMLKALAKKATDPEVGARLTYENLSNTELGSASGGPYDLVFSNLGGLNCIADPGAVTGQLTEVLKPGGKAVLVLMPPLCPWEVLQALRGHVRTAFRRVHGGGVEANVAGVRVRTWYFSPARLERALGPEFETLALRSFCTFVPPPYFEGVSQQHPSLVERLMRVDDLVGSAWPFNRLGDFYALTSQRRGGS